MAWTVPNLNARAEFAKALRAGLVTPPIIVKCEDCHWEVSSDMRWQCGYCSKENRRTEIDSFLNECQHCQRAPKSYRCPDCGWINFLDGDKDITHPAVKAVPKPPKQKPPPPVDVDGQRRKAHETVILEKKREIEKTELDLKLFHLKAAMKDRSQMTPQERRVAWYRRFRDLVAGDREALRKVSSEVRADYADDPEEGEAIIAEMKKQSEDIAAGLPRANLDI